MVVFLEPIALDPMRDLHADKDGGWMTRYPAPDQVIALGEVGVQGEGTDLAIVSFANGHYLSQQALPALTEAGIKTRLVDLRWLSPMPADALIAATAGCKNVLIVDELSLIHI